MPLCVINIGVELAPLRAMSKEHKTLQQQIEANRKVTYTESRFQSLFDDIVRTSLRASVLASAVALGGCGLSHSTTPAVNEMTCEETKWRPTTGLNAATPFDHIAVFTAPCRGCLPETTVVDSNGTPCEGATDADACLAEIDALVNQSTHVRYTDADGVHTVMPSELPSFLGTIDTPDEALLVVQQAGFNIRCGSDDVSVETVADGFLVRTTKMTRDCAPVEVTGFLLMVSSSGEITELDATVISSTSACVGRRPEGLIIKDRVEGRSELGRFLGEVARLEESAVAAFRFLAEELRFHGAPQRLIDACINAADDEARHTVQMTELATRFGARPQPPCFEPQTVRPLFEVALENAIEGCVRETYGALVGVHQSLQAEDAQIRNTMRGIAEDETRHASVSWQIAAWIEPLLSESERAIIHDKKMEAIATLRIEMGQHPSTELVEVAGMPTRDTALRMLEQLSSTVWA